MFVVWGSIGNMNGVDFDIKLEKHNSQSRSNLQTIVKLDDDWSYVEIVWALCTDIFSTDFSFIIIYDACNVQCISNDNHFCSMLSIMDDKCSTDTSKPPYSYVALIAMAIDVSILSFSYSYCGNMDIVQLVQHTKEQ